MKIDFNLLGKLASEYEYTYKVEDFYGDLIAHKLDKDFGVYVDFNTSNDTFSCDAIGLKIRMNDISSYEELYKMFESKLQSNGNDAHLKNKFSYFMEDIGFTGKFGELKDYSRYSFNVMGFFDMLWWLKTDEFIRNGEIGSGLEKQAQEYADKYGRQDTNTFFHPTNGLRFQINYGQWIDMNTVDAKFNGITMKFFLNGKIQIKGLSNDEWESILNLKEICK